MLFSVGCFNCDGASQALLYSKRENLLQRIIHLHAVGDTHNKSDPLIGYIEPSGNRAGPNQTFFVISRLFLADHPLTGLQLPLSSKFCHFPSPSFPNLYFSAA